jgi:hypothetical protein
VPLALTNSLVVTGFFQKEEIKKGIMSSSEQRHVVITFLMSLLKNEGTEEPCVTRWWRRTGRTDDEVKEVEVRA